MSGQLIGVWERKEIKQTKNKTLENLLYQKRTKLNILIRYI